MTAASTTSTTTTLSGVLPLDELTSAPDPALPGDTPLPLETHLPDETPFPGEAALPDNTPLPDDTPLAESPAEYAAMRSGETTPRRKRVTLGPPEPERSAPRVYYAPPKDGLSTFDLGTVPASVTPPRSWRKAAWFATVSSGGVVVALLVAASYFVGQQPPQDQVAVDNWTGLRGENPPQLHNEGLADTAEPTAGMSLPPTSSQPDVIADRAVVLPSGTTVTMSTAPQLTSAPGSASPTMTMSPSASPTTSQQPQKPSPTPAPRETRSDYFYRFPPDADTMGDRSEIFLNEITENPEKAHEQTGGDLYAEGAESIAARYSHIAYFEIEHIYIDQRNRVTVNTVKAVFTDGTWERQQRTLRFEEGDKITED